MTSINEQLDTLEKGATFYQTRGYRVVPVDNKRVQAKKWQTSNFAPATIRRHLDSAERPRIGIVWDGVTIDVEDDDAEQEAECLRLIGDAADTGAAFISRNRTDHQGTHRLFRLPADSPIHDLLTSSGIIKLPSGLTARIKGVQSVVPPSENREWLPGRDIDTVAIIPDALHDALIEQARQDAVIAAEAAALAATRNAIDIREPTEAEIADCEATLMGGEDSIEGMNGSNRAIRWGAALRRSNVRFDRAWEVIQRINDAKGKPPWPLYGHDGQNLDRKLREGFRAADKKGERGSTLIRIDELCAVRDASLDLLDGAPATGDAQSEGCIIESPRNISRRLPTPLVSHWLYPGVLTLLAAPQGHGKSLVAANIVAPLTREGKRVMFTAPEEPSEMIGRRMDVAGADPAFWDITRAAFARRRGQSMVVDLNASAEGLENIEITLAKFGDVGVMVFDALTDMLPTGTSENANAEVRSVLNALTALAGKYKVALLGLCHYNKSTDCTEANRMIIGSTGFVSIPRSIWHITGDPADRERRLLLPSKYSYTRRPPGRAFCITPVMYDPDVPYDASNHVAAPEDADDHDTVGRVVWEDGLIDMDADAGLRALANAANDKKRGGSAREAACEWLLRFVADQAWHELSNVYLAAQAAGMSQRAIEGAITHLRSHTGEIKTDKEYRATKIMLTEQARQYDAD
ncbi:AAA family ATPase [Lacipirellula sp.]|uniref:AAA family ATPase n=1 Tax=Lacipirellula sp. TaxID=2691419 RepID=UPI003D0F5B09